MEKDTEDYNYEERGGDEDFIYNQDFESLLISYINQEDVEEEVDIDPSILFGGDITNEIENFNKRQNVNFIQGFAELTDEDEVTRVHKLRDRFRQETTEVSTDLYTIENFQTKAFMDESEVIDMANAQVLEYNEEEEEEEENDQIDSLSERLKGSVSSFTSQELQGTTMSFDTYKTIEIEVHDTIFDIILSRLLKMVNFSYLSEDVYRQKFWRLPGHPRFTPDMNLIKRNKYLNSSLRIRSKMKVEQNVDIVNIEFTTSENMSILEDKIMKMASINKYYNKNINDLSSELDYKPQIAQSVLCFLRTNKNNGMIQSFEIVFLLLIFDNVSFEMPYDNQVLKNLKNKKTIVDQILKDSLEISFTQEELVNLKFDREDINSIIDFLKFKKGQYLDLKYQEKITLEETDTIDSQIYFDKINYKQTYANELYMKIFNMNWDGTYIEDSNVIKTMTDFIERTETNDLEENMGEKNKNMLDEISKFRLTMSNPSLYGDEITSEMEKKPEIKILTEDNCPYSMYIPFVSEPIEVKLDKNLDKKDNLRNLFLSRFKLIVEELDFKNNIFPVYGNEDAKLVLSGFLTSFHEIYETFGKKAYEPSENFRSIKSLDNKEQKEIEKKFEDNKKAAVEKFMDKTNEIQPLKLKKMQVKIDDNNKYSFLNFKQGLNKLNAVSKHMYIQNALSQSVIFGEAYPRAKIPKSARYEVTKEDILKIERQTIRRILLDKFNIYTNLIVNLLNLILLRDREGKSNIKEGITNVNQTEAVLELWYNVLSTDIKSLEQEYKEDAVKIKIIRMFKKRVWKNKKFDLTKELTSNLEIFTKKLLLDYFENLLSYEPHKEENKKVPDYIKQVISKLKEPNTILSNVLNAADFCKIHQLFVYNSNTQRDESFTIHMLLKANTSENGFDLLDLDYLLRTSELADLIYKNHNKVKERALGNFRFEINPIDIKTIKLSKRTKEGTIEVKQFPSYYIGNVPIRVKFQVLNEQSIELVDNYIESMFESDNGNPLFYTEYENEVIQTNVKDFNYQEFQNISKQTGEWLISRLSKTKMGKHLIITENTFNSLLYLSSKKCEANELQMIQTGVPGLFVFKTGHANVNTTNEEVPFFWIYIKDNSIKNCHFEFLDINGISMIKGKKFTVYASKVMRIGYDRFNYFTTAFTSCMALVMHAFGERLNSMNVKDVPNINNDNLEKVFQITKKEVQISYLITLCQKKELDRINSIASYIFKAALSEKNRLSYFMKDKLKMLYKTNVTIWFLDKILKMPDTLINQQSKILEMARNNVNFKREDFGEDETDISTILSLTTPYAENVNTLHLLMFHAYLETTQIKSLGNRFKGLAEGLKTMHEMNKSLLNADNKKSYNSEMDFSAFVSKIYTGDLDKNLMLYKPLAARAIQYHLDKLFSGKANSLRLINKLKNICETPIIQDGTNKSSVMSRFRLAGDDQRYKRSVTTGYQYFKNEVKTRMDCMKEALQDYSYPVISEENKDQHSENRHFLILDVFSIEALKILEETGRYIDECSDNEFITIPSDKRKLFLQKRYNELNKLAARNGLNFMSFNFDQSKWAPSWLLDVFDMICDVLYNITKCELFITFRSFLQYYRNKAMVIQEMIRTKGELNNLNLIPFLIMFIGFGMGMYNFLSSLVHDAIFSYLEYIFTQTEVQTKILDKVVKNYKAGKSNLNVSDNEDYMNAKKRSDYYKRLKSQLEEDTDTLRDEGRYKSEDKEYNIKEDIKLVEKLKNIYNKLTDPISEEISNLLDIFKERLKNTDFEDINKPLIYLMKIYRLKFLGEKSLFNMLDTQIEKYNIIILNLEKEYERNKNLASEENIRREYSKLLNFKMMWAVHSDDQNVMIIYRFNEQFIYFYQFHKIFLSAVNLKTNYKKSIISSNLTELVSIYVIGGNIVTPIHKIIANYGNLYNYQGPQTDYSSLKSLATEYLRAGATLIQSSFIITLANFLHSRKMRKWYNAGNILQKMNYKNLGIDENKLPLSTFGNSRTDPLALFAALDYHDYEKLHNLKEKLSTSQNLEIMLKNMDIEEAITLMLFNDGLFFSNNMLSDDIVSGKLNVNRLLTSLNLNYGFSRKTDLFRKTFENILKDVKETVKLTNEEENILRIMFLLGKITNLTKEQMIYWFKLKVLNNKFLQAMVRDNPTAKIMKFAQLGSELMFSINLNKEFARVIINIIKLEKEEFKDIIYYIGINTQDKRMNIEGHPIHLENLILSTNELTMDVVNNRRKDRFAGIITDQDEYLKEIKQYEDMNKKKYKKFGSNYNTKLKYYNAKSSYYLQAINLLDENDDIVLRTNHFQFLKIMSLLFKYIKKGKHDELNKLFFEKAANYVQFPLSEITNYEVISKTMEDLKTINFSGGIHWVPRLSVTVPKIKKTTFIGRNRLQDILPLAIELPENIRNIYKPIIRYPQTLILDINYYKTLWKKVLISDSNPVKKMEIMAFAINKFEKSDRLFVSPISSWSKFGKFAFLNMQYNSIRYTKLIGLSVEDEFLKELFKRDTTEDRNVYLTDMDWIYQFNNFHKISMYYMEQLLEFFGTPEFNYRNVNKLKNIVKTKTKKDSDELEQMKSFMKDSKDILNIIKRVLAEDKDLLRQLDNNSLLNQVKKPFSLRNKMSIDLWITLYEIVMDYVREFNMMAEIKEIKDVATMSIDEMNKKFNRILNENTAIKNIVERLNYRNLTKLPIYYFNKVFPDHTEKLMKELMESKKIVIPYVLQAQEKIYGRYNLESKMVLYFQRGIHKTFVFYENREFNIITNFLDDESLNAIVNSIDINNQDLFKNSAFRINHNVQTIKEWNDKSIFFITEEEKLKYSESKMKYHLKPIIYKGDVYLGNVKVTLNKSLVIKYFNEYKESIQEFKKTIRRSDYQISGSVYLDKVTRNSYIDRIRVQMSGLYTTIRMKSNYIKHIINNQEILETLNRYMDKKFKVKEDKKGVEYEKEYLQRKIFESACGVFIIEAEKLNTELDIFKLSKYDVSIMLDLNLNKNIDPSEVDGLEKSSKTVKPAIINTKNYLMNLRRILDSLYLDASIDINLMLNSIEKAWYLYKAIIYAGESNSTTARKMITLILHTKIYDDILKLLIKNKNTFDIRINEMTDKLMPSEDFLDSEDKYVTYGFELLNLIFYSLNIFATNEVKSKDLRKMDITWLNKWTNIVPFNLDGYLKTSETIVPINLDRVQIENGFASIFNAIYKTRNKEYSEILIMRINKFIKEFYDEKYNVLNSNNMLRNLDNLNKDKSKVPKLIETYKSGWLQFSDLINRLCEYPNEKNIVLFKTYDYLRKALELNITTIQNLMGQYNNTFYIVNRLYVLNSLTDQSTRISENSTIFNIIVEYDKEKYAKISYDDEFN